MISTGATLTLKGTQLDQVATVKIGGVSVLPSTITATQVSLVAPAAPTSTSIVLVLNNGSTQTLSQTIRVDPVVTITDWGPKSGLSTATTTVTLNGSGLAKGNGVAQLQLAGVNLTLAAQSDTQLSATLPPGMAGGTLSLLSNLPGYRLDVGNFDVVAGVVVSGMTPSAGPAQTVVRVSGRSLDSVTAVTVGGVAATISGKTSTTLDFAAPAQSGDVILSAPLNQQVKAGSFSYQPPAPVAAPPPATLASVSFEQIDMAQTYSQPIGPSSSVALVSGKAALLRAFVVASSVVAAPAISASLSGCASMPVLRLNGPATLPTVRPALTDNTNTFSATVPADCVKAGLSLTLSAAASANTSAATSATQTPKVARANASMDLVLVPLVTNGTTAKIPTAADLSAIAAMFDAAYPLNGPARITVRAPFTLVATTVSSSSQWSAALSEVRKLADAEGKGKQYYGLVPLPNFTSGTDGNAYVNPVGNTASSAWMAAIGTDSGLSSWIKTMAHEIGHNNSLEHAPCGTSDGNPSSRPYPYANAALGPYPMVDPNGSPNTFVLPATAPTSKSNEHDYMSYCNSRAFSDFNYANIQSFQNSFSYASMRPFDAPVTMLDFSGEIVGNQVRLWPTTARSTTEPYAGDGDWSLHLTLADGTQLAHAFRPVRVADGDSDMLHFEVSVPLTHDVTQLAIRRAGVPLEQVLQLPPHARSQKAASATNSLAVPSGTGSAPVAWSEVKGQLLLAWDANVAPVLGVRHIGQDGRTTLLALHLFGGRAELPLAQVSAGGRWEFSLSSGYTARLFTSSRP